MKMNRIGFTGKITGNVKCGRCNTEYTYDVYDIIFSHHGNASSWNVFCPVAGCNTVRVLANEKDTK